MHNNYYFLRQLSSALANQLIGYSVVSCFSQNKEELIIEFNNGKQSFFLKGHFLSSFCCLVFPGSFSRARKNTVDLFDEMLLKKVTGISQFENERSFAIQFEQDYMLVFKMHGSRSNILLLEEGKVIRIFRNQFKDDFSISINTLNRQIDWSENYFKSNRHNLKTAYFTLGREVWNYLHDKGFNDLEINAQWKLFNETLSLLNRPTFYILRRGDLVKFSLLPGEEIIYESKDPIKSINEFFYLNIQNNALQKQKSSLARKLTASITSNQSYVEKNERKLIEIEDGSQYKSWADLLMANLHQIEKGSHKVLLTDFSGSPVSIKLKPELSAQKNAEVFYRKAKNQEIEKRKLTEAITQKKSEVQKQTEELNLLNQIETLEEFRSHFKTQEQKIVKKKDPIPFHEVEFNGFQIWIGKNAINNDLLTLKYTHKEDLWLHAKDVSGSHVVIKHQAGKKFPKEVIERGAELAAYNSKRKTETLCPVSYTQKKYVRKRKGDPPGTVIVEREEVIMVTPKL